MSADGVRSRLLLSLAIAMALAGCGSSAAQTPSAMPSLLPTILTATPMPTATQVPTASGPVATPLTTPMGVDAVIDAAPSSVTADAVVADWMALDRSVYGDWATGLAELFVQCSYNPHLGCWRYVTTVYDVYYGYAGQASPDPKLLKLLEDSVGFAKTALSPSEFTALVATWRSLPPRPLPTTPLPTATK
ncbi:MAG: hypothetical protein ABSB34_03065 [Candidatus Limnocylindrales bacterium]